MDEKSLFARFWTDESKTTRNVLARIPEASDYGLDPKSRTAQEIAWQIVCEEKMIIEALGERQGRVGAAADAGDDGGSAGARMSRSHPDDPLARALGRAGVLASCPLPAATARFRRAIPLLRDRRPWR